MITIAIIGLISVLLIALILTICEKYILRNSIITVVFILTSVLIGFSMFYSICESKDYTKDGYEYYSSISYVDDNGITITLDDGYYKKGNKYYNVEYEISSMVWIPFGKLESELVEVLDVSE